MPIKFTRELLESCSGTPPKGCRFCDRGSKMVLYITGICSEDCFYCPLSEEKKGNDVIYANERKVDGPDWLDQVIDEAERMDALGTGITGGDPMLVPERTRKAILALKDGFGRRHHIHLYTTGSFEIGLLSDMKNAGLDEIRFHPNIAYWKQFRFLGRDAEEGDPLDASIYHDLIFEARRVGLSVGLEIPAVVNTLKGGEIYSEGLHSLLDYAAREGMEFVNVNELEASHTNMDRFGRMGYELVGDSMAVKGSMELAVSTIEKTRLKNQDSPTVFHICSSVFKDSVQLRNRLVRTANNTARPFEIPTEDGTLLRGIVESEDIDGVVDYLREIYDVPEELYKREGEYLIVAPWILQEVGLKLPGKCHISEVYPTWDSLEVERIPIQPDP
jgi:hypothetical protein